MSATKTQKQKARDKEPMFEDEVSFEFFLEEVEHAAHGAGVKTENIDSILELLKEKFGQGLPPRES